MQISDDEINTLLEQFDAQVKQSFRAAGLSNAKVRGQFSVKYLTAATHYAQALGFVFNALGIWDKFPPGIVIACMRSDDPFSQVWKVKGQNVAGVERT